MKTLTRKGSGWRCRLLTLDRAERFAKCLEGNAQYSGVTIQESTRAKEGNPARWFVTWQPSKAERLLALHLTFQDERRQRALEQYPNYVFAVDVPSGGAWVWCCNVETGEVYEVTVRNCTCPDYGWRCEHAGLECKHMIMLEIAAEAGDIQTAFGEPAHGSPEAQAAQAAQQEAELRAAAERERQERQELEAAAQRDRRARANRDRDALGG